LAVTLARLGKTVLLVDADPQCNLTSYFLDAPEHNNEKLEDIDSEELKEVEDDDSDGWEHDAAVAEEQPYQPGPLDLGALPVYELHDAATKLEADRAFSLDRGRSSIWSAMRRVFDNHGDVSVEIVKAINDSENSDVTERVWLIAGDVRLVKFEGALARAAGLGSDSSRSANTACGRLPQVRVVLACMGMWIQSYIFDIQGCKRSSAQG
jgi:hypothetical protein